MNSPLRFAAAILACLITETGFSQPFRLDSAGYVAGAAFKQFLMAEKWS